MLWTNFADDRGHRWQVNQLGLWILVRQHVYNRLLKQRSRVVRETRFIGPDSVSVETDFRGIDAARDRESHPLYADLERRVANNPAAMLRVLVQMRHETEHNSTELRRMHRAASHETYNNIQRSVSRGETGVAVATFVRDLSATTLVVCSSFMTGGAALSVLGLGSGLKGAYRYQDTGNVGSALFETVGTFVVGAIPIGAAGEGGLSAGASLTRSTIGGEAINYGERGAVIVVGSLVDASLETSKAVIDGQSARNALMTGGTRFGIDILSGQLGLRLDSRAFPVASRLVFDTLTSITADRAVRAFTPAESPLPRATTGGPSAMPIPTRQFCDANSILSTGDCDSAEWVRQLVVHPA